MRSNLDVTQSDELHAVAQYFDSTASRFASIYTAPRLVDRILRRDMYERFRKTLEACEPLAGRSVLDVGCGSGLYTTALAEKGAGEVVGLDFANNMIQIALDDARRARVGDRCRFIVGDFLTHPFDRRFDYVLAVGVFDYLRSPLPFLRRAREVTKGKLIATFPRMLTWRAPVRKVRLTLAGCPVFFYTGHRVETLMQQAGFDLESCELCGKIYFVTARPHDRGDLH